MQKVRHDLIFLTCLRVTTESGRFESTSGDLTTMVTKSSTRKASLASLDGLCVTGLASNCDGVGKMFSDFVIKS